MVFLRVLCPLALVLAAPAALAQSLQAPPAAASAAAPATSASPLAQIQSEIALLKAKAALAAAQSSADGGGPAAASPASPMGLPGMPGAALPSAEVVPSTPTVLGVYGHGTQLTVAVAMPDGRRAEVAPGAVLPGGAWRVRLTSTGTEIVPVSHHKRSH